MNGANEKVSEEIRLLRGIFRALVNINEHLVAIHNQITFINHESEEQENGTN